MDQNWQDPPGLGHISGVSAGSIIQRLSLVRAVLSFGPKPPGEGGSQLAQAGAPRGCPPVFVLFTARRVVCQVAL